MIKIQINIGKANLAPNLSTIIPPKNVNTILGRP